ncbi:MAG: ribokinase [Candidatus Zixiibacteriota bacterium]|nr:MAG: ribokinase [candidate division Zixibacteria bacterium]
MITAIGNPVYDYIKTPKTETGQRVLSGCSTNAALALAKLGADVRLVGAIGEDFKADFIEKLTQYKVKHTIVPSKQSGGFSLIYYDDYGNRTLDLLGRATGIGTLNPEQYRASEAVLIAPILGEVSLEDIRIIRNNYKGFYFCDPQGLLRGADESGRIYHEKVDGIEDALGQFTVVKPNELEGRVLTGIDCRKDPYRAARIIKSWGPEIVIVTLAELGSVIYDGKDFIDIPPYAVDLVDSTGAGDTYMAGFTFEYLRTGDLRMAGCFASCVSSVMIEQVGPDFVLSEAEIRRHREMLLKKTDFRVAVSMSSI